MPKRTLDFVGNVIDILRSRGVTEDSKIAEKALGTIISQSVGRNVVGEYIKVMKEWGILIPLQDDEAGLFRIDFEKAAELMI